MAGGTLFIKVLPEKGAELAIQKAVERGGQQAESTSKDSGGRWGLGFAAAAGAAIGKGLQGAAALEQIEVSLTTMLGSGAEAKEMLGDLTDFARSTPFEMQGLAANARNLLGVGVAAEDVIPTLQTLGDASAALGLNQEQMDRVLRAVTQSMAKGKVQSEEMLQLAEAGIPIYDLMARAVGKTVPEMQEMAANGELLAADVLPKLFAEMDKDFAGGMVAQSKTLNGVLSTVKDDINLGLAEAVKFLIPLLADLLPSAAKAAGGVITAFGFGLRAVVTLATPLIQLLDALLEGFGSLPAPIQTAIVAALLMGRIMGVSLVGALFSFTGALIANRAAIWANMVAAGSLTGALGVLGRAAAGAAGRTGLGALSGALFGGGWGLAAIGIGLVVTAILDISDNAEDAREKMDALVGSLDFSNRQGVVLKIRELREEMQRLQQEIGNVATSGGLTGLELLWSSMDEEADAARDKMDELRESLERYHDNSEQVAADLDLTVAQLERLALAAGVDLNLLAGDKEDVEAFLTALTVGNGAIEAGIDPTSRLGQAIAQLGDESGTAAERAEGLKLALEQLAGGRVSVLEATAGWQESLADLVESFQTTDKEGNTVLNDLALKAVDAAGNINLLSEEGRGVQEAVLGAADAMRTSAQAAYENALASGDAAGAAKAAGAAADASRQDFINQMVQLGLTAEQAAGLADTYGLIPGQVVTAVSMPGMTASQVAADTLRGKILSVPDSKTVITSALTADAVGRLEALGFKVERLPDGNVRVTAATSEAEDAINHVARNRVTTITVNTKAGVHRGNNMLGGTLLEADGGRVEFFAGGGMRAFGRTLTPMRANWAQVVPANTWRVIGDRARGREWYVPEDAPNTLPVLADAAAAHGLQLVRAMAEGGLLGGKPITVPAGPGRVTNIRNNLYAAPTLPTIDQLQRMQRKAEVLAGA